MAIGTALAVGLGSAVIGGVGSAIASGNNSRAIDRSTEAQTQSTAQSTALQRDIYSQNQATLSPFVNRGNAAGEQMNALLGLGGGTQQPTQPTQPNALTQFRGGPSPAGYYGVGDESIFGYDGRPDGPNAFWQNYGQTGPQTAGWSGQPNPAGTMSAANQPQSAQGAAEDAFDIFRNSTGYQFRLGEGMDAVNSGWAGAGTLQSGAAMRAINEYGQNFASNEFGNYMGYLGNQQGTGLQAAGAQAGVGLNYANNVSNLNQQNANALSNAAVARANNSNALIGSIGGAVGGVLGQLGG